MARRGNLPRPHSAFPVPHSTMPETGPCVKGGSGSRMLWFSFFCLPAYPVSRSWRVSEVFRSAAKVLRNTEELTTKLDRSRPGLWPNEYILHHKCSFIKGR